MIYHFMNKLANELHLFKLNIFKKMILLIIIINIKFILNDIPYLYMYGFLF